MCGISGVYAQQITENHQQQVQAMVDSQLSRGPDHQALVKLESPNGKAILGHNRLTIIDLSAAAHQPLWDVERRYCIVFNGEIYNYIELRAELMALGKYFQTQGDTEVILNAFSQWGINALQYLRGPFAFALFDTWNGELWLCRDRFGIRPLYYSQDRCSLYFASTTTALASVIQLKPNLDYLVRGLNYLVYEKSGDDSAFVNAIAVPAGHYIRVKLMPNGDVSLFKSSYYSLFDNVQHRIETLAVQSIDDLLHRIAYQLDESINIRLRADVPLAISLSGGLDSSSIAALVSKKQNNLVGFSFSSPQEKKSEGPLVAHCAKFLNMQVHYVWPSAEEMIQAFYQTLSIQGAPFASFSIVAQFLLYKRVRESGIKVLLGGQGGDEAFMGYRKFLFFWLRQTLQKKRIFSAMKQVMMLLPMVAAEIKSLGIYWQHRHRYTKHHQHTSPLSLPQAETLSLGQSPSSLWQRQLLDITQFSLPTLLRYEDRNSMGNSVESRLPFMDHDLIELALALPETIKLRHGYGKWALRKIMQAQLPDQIRLARYKRGFDIPLTSLLKAGLGRSIRSTLQSNRERLADYLPTSVSINEIFSDQRFLQRNKTMTEAITLLWLNRVIS